MIPANITRTHLLRAVAYIDAHGVPPHRQATGYVLRIGTQTYPPKYVVSVANRWANGTDWPANRFSGGAEVGRFLAARGLTQEARGRAEPPEDAESAPAADVASLLKALLRYREVRQAFLHVLDRPTSNRDPLAEFSEVWVAMLLGGTLAASRVQRDYDLLDPEGRRVQVRYVANPRTHWVNEHAVVFNEAIDRYAVVLIEDLAPRAVVVFARETLAAVGQALHKRHPDQDRQLFLTRRNVQTLLQVPATFARLGVAVLRPEDMSRKGARR